jgi:hypothetical protein
MTPGNLSKVKFQGIIVHVAGANIPIPKLAHARKRIWIEAVPMVGHIPVELFEMTSVELKKNRTKPGSMKLNRRANYSEVEEIITRDVLDIHDKDKVHQKCCSHKKGRDTMFLNYLVDSSKYALVTNNSEADLIPCSGVEFPPQLRAVFARYGIIPPLRVHGV